MVTPTLALLFQVATTQPKIDAAKIIQTSITYEVEKPVFPTVQEIANKCGADPSCVAAKQWSDQQAEIRRLTELNLSTLYPQTVNNSYAPGNCTWYVASRRKAGAYWGNASNWLNAARSAGYETGATPYRGAIAHTAAGWAGHVALVESVNGDMVTISEMNYQGYNVISTRTVHYSEFSYIYG